MLALWKKSYDKSRQCIKKQRHHFTDKGPYSQRYGFLSSLLAQLVKNLPAMRKTWVQLLGCKDPLEKGKATHFSILAQLELDMGQQTGSKQGKKYIKAVYCHPVYLTYMQNTS